jgi:hypothetical protein
VTGEHTFILTPACGDTRRQSARRSGTNCTSAASESVRLREKGAERLRSTAETGTNGGSGLSSDLAFDERL